ncbi:hypothetical protein ACT4UL_05270, partial [Bacillus sp. HC-TM]
MEKQQLLNCHNATVITINDNIIVRAAAFPYCAEVIVNFNNFSIIYLFNGGGPAVAGQDAGG